MNFVSNTIFGTKTILCRFHPLSFFGNFCAWFWYYLDLDSVIQVGLRTYIRIRVEFKVGLGFVPNERAKVQSGIHRHLIKFEIMKTKQIAIFCFLTRPTCSERGPQGRLRARIQCPWQCPRPGAPPFSDVRKIMRLFLFLLSFFFSLSVCLFFCFLGLSERWPS